MQIVTNFFASVLAFLGSLFGFAGSSTPAEPAPQPAPVDSGNSWELVNDTTLRVTGPVPACSILVAQDVQETATSVTIDVESKWTAPADRACPAIMTTGSVDVTLDKPLGNRTVTIK
ncbi:hypothetical protein [uncultured Corynebacterium sp.]|uniref:hypothetical protein n=1 Tax=uncultured Corynebacterium sp. TaxID=159447 RepID=UPI0025D2887C|nr:hypothetical protein [uncultured Corynebacterium sp.]